MVTFNKNNLLLLIPIFIGLAGFFIVVGPKALNPTNIDWLLRGESLEDHLAWIFFRESAWSFPVGLNPNYGLEISSSIVYSDSIPLFAILFKLLDPFISNPFQYFGIWLLACFLLQSFAAWVLIRLATENIIILIFSTALFIFSPPFLWRIGELQGALVGHFLILFAIYLNLRPYQSKRIFFWCILLCISVLVHFYIFAMVFILWIASIADCTISQKLISLKISFCEFLTIIFFVFLCAWQAGYFAISSGSASEWGYGQFNFNLLSIFYPRGWSQFSLIKEFVKDFESFNYLGLGILFFILSAFPIGLIFMWQKNKSFRSKHFFFILTLCLCLIYAISNNIDIGNWSYSFPIPEALMPIANILRHSNRLFWPVYYSALVFSIYCLIQINNKKIVYLCLITIFCLQVYDTQAGWMPLRNKLMWPDPPEDGFPLKNQFWKDVAKKYKNVVKIPISHKPPQWGIFARYAAENHLATNSVSFARIDKERMNKSNSQFLEMINTGKYSSDTLFIIDEWKLLPITVNFDPNKDLFARIDGYNILAPNWKICGDCPQISKEFEITRLAPPTHLQKKIFFRQNDDGRNQFLQAGWSWPGEDWGTWSDQNNASILLPMPTSGTPKLIDFNLRALVSPSHPIQSAKIFINGILVTEIILSKMGENLISVPIPSSELTKPYLHIEFKFFNAISPTAIGLGNGDTRRLAVGLKSLEFK